MFNALVDTAIADYSATALALLHFIATLAEHHYNAVIAVTFNTTLLLLFAAAFASFIYTLFAFAFALVPASREQSDSTTKWLSLCFALNGIRCAKKSYRRFSRGYFATIM